MQDRRDVDNTTYEGLVTGNRATERGVAADSDNGHWPSGYWSLVVGRAVFPFLWQRVFWLPCWLITISRGRKLPTRRSAPSIYGRTGTLTRVRSLPYSISRAAVLIMSGRRTYHGDVDFHLQTISILYSISPYAPFISAVQLGFINFADLVAQICIVHITLRRFIIAVVDVHPPDCIVLISPFSRNRRYPGSESQPSNPFWA